MNVECNRFVSFGEQTKLAFNHVIRIPYLKTRLKRGEAIAIEAVYKGVSIGNSSGTFFSKLFGRKPLVMANSKSIPG
jgi:hypothetical protein